MTPLGWGWAAFVWGYALAWFLVTDRVKLLAYRILDPVKAGQSLRPSRSQTGAKASLKPEAKAEPQAGSAKPSLSLKPKPQPKPEAKAKRQSRQRQSRA